jgi:nicotinamidase-related amidase
MQKPKLNREPKLLACELAKTALLVVDPYNDCLHPRGLRWPGGRSTMKSGHVIDHMAQLIASARLRGVVVAYAPHHRYKEGSHAERRFPHPSHLRPLGLTVFREGRFGGQFHEATAPSEGDLVAAQHSCSSGFAGTDLHDLLQVRGITHVVLVGMTTNSCIEATARSAVDLDYHVTLVHDAVGAFSPEEHAEAVQERYPLLGHVVTNASSLLQQWGEA